MAAACIAVILLGAIPARAAFYGMIEDGWEKHVRAGIYRIANTDFEGGLSMLEEYINAFPRNPGGYFYYAAGVQEKIQKFNDLSELPRFYKYARKCQTYATLNIRKNPDDSVSRLFLGAIEGYMGMLEAKQRHLLRAFRHGVNAKSHLERVLIERPEVPDTYFGLGMLYYFSSRKGAEEGGLVDWIIRKFITHGRDMKDRGMLMLNHAVDHHALSEDYARSALMWIYLYEKEYDKAEQLGYQVVNSFQMDTNASWVLGRVALAEGRCGDAKFWLGRVVKINEELGLPNSDYKDVDMAIRKAELCRDMKEGDYEQAFELNEQVLGWLSDDPKITLEYQDEKNLISKWKEESEDIRRRLRFFTKRNS